MRKSLGILCSIMILSISIPTQAQETITLSDEIIENCEYYGSMYGICPELLESIIWAESRGQKSAKNNTCIGICQINLSSQSDRLSESMTLVGTNDKYDIKAQIRTMCDLLYELSYQGYSEEQCDIAEVLAMYHGESNVKKKYATGYMSDYVKDILANAYILEELHGKH